MIRDGMGAGGESDNSCSGRLRACLRGDATAGIYQYHPYQPTTGLLMAIRCAYGMDSEVDAPGVRRKAPPSLGVARLSENLQGAIGHGVVGVGARLRRGAQGALPSREKLERARQTLNAALRSHDAAFAGDVSVAPDAVAEAGPCERC